MKRWCAGFAWSVAVASALHAAEENFTKALAAGDFSAAGLSKLSPEEIARLDALVRDFKSGALERARREAAAAEARAAKAEAEAKRASARAVDSEKKSEPSLLAKAKVLLTPGTEIEYSTVESRLVGDFRGWEGRTIFTLENGQRWQATSSDSYVSPPIAAPVVKISPGVLGTFWMSFEGVRRKVKVELVRSGR